jgi:hypothetical protein
LKLFRQLQRFFLGEAERRAPIKSASSCHYLKDYGIAASNNLYGFGPLHTTDLDRHTRTMPEKRSKRPRDPAQLAKLMIDIASGEVQDQKPSPVSELARQGGMKGGRARADKLSPERRAEIAREAAKKRWRKVVSQFDCGNCVG